MDPSTRVRDTTAIAATASHIHELLYRVAVIEYVCLILCHKCESQLLRRSGRIWWNRLDPFVTGRRDRSVVYSYRVVSCLGRNSHLFCCCRTDRRRPRCAGFPVHWFSRYGVCMHLKRFVFAAALTFIATSASLFAAAPAAEQAHPGYYRFPAVHGDSIVFTSEGDLWSVSIHGGAAQRLTTSLGMEHFACISPDGKTIAFQAAYEGPAEVYTMPITGGLPERRTWDDNASPAGWTPEGRLMVITSRYSGI